MQPPARHLVELELLRQVGIVGRNLDVDRLRVLPLQRGDHLLGQPQEALLVGGQHGHRRVFRPRLDELVPRLRGDCLPQRRRLAEARFQADGRPGLHLRQDVALELRPEVIDLPRNVELIVEDGDGIRDPLARGSHGRGVLQNRGRLRVCGQIGVERRVRGLEIDLRVKGLDRLPVERLQHVVYFTDRQTCLRAAALQAEEIRRMLLHVVEPERAPGRVPDVRQAPRQVHRGRVGAGRVGAGDDGRRGRSEGARDDLDRPFARSQIVEPRLADLHQLPDEVVVPADKNGIGLAGRVGDLARVARQRQRDAGRLEPEPRGDVRGAHRFLRVPDDDRRLEPIGDEVDVRVAEPALDGIRVREVEGLRRNRRDRRAERSAGAAHLAGGRRRGRSRAAAGARGDSFGRRVVTPTASRRSLRCRLRRGCRGWSRTARTASPSGTSACSTCSTFSTSAGAFRAWRGASRRAPSRAGRRGRDDRAASRFLVRRRQRARVQSGSAHGRLAGLPARRPDLHHCGGVVRVVQCLRLEAAPVGEVEILDRLRGPRDVTRGDVDPERHPRQTAAIAVHNHRAHAADGAGHRAALQVRAGLALHLADARAGRAPEPRQIHRQLVGRVQGAVIVGADDGNPVRAAER